MCLFPLGNVKLGLCLFIILTTTTTTTTIANPPSSSTISFFKVQTSLSLSLSLSLSITGKKSEMGVATMGTDPLSERAAIMRESLQKSQTITDNVVSILGSFDHRLSALETAMRPTQVGSFSSSSFLFGYSENWGGKDKRICEKMEFWG